MAKLADIEIAGASGKKYSFEIYPSDSTWNEIGAVYVVSKRTMKPGGGGSHEFIYVGQTDNLKERHANHHKANCFEKHGFNCVCVHVEKDEETRLGIEADLVDARAWPCNG